MANMTDYIDWRGDIGFDYDPFNEVDSLILTNLSYVDFDGVVPGIGGGDITLAEACVKFFMIHSEEEYRRSKSFVAFAPFLMQKLATCERFHNTRLRNYVNHVDAEKEVQFSALEILTEDGVSFVSFCGTDDTLVGWKEDFNMSYMVVPADGLALDYLNAIHGYTDMPIRVGGHSKGGHLAIYASALCDPLIQNRIIAVYDHDGPGFSSEFMEEEGLKNITSRINRVIPDTSIIGMLMEHNVTPMVVKSSESGMNQHAALSWQVKGKHFETVDELSATGKVLDDTIKSWMYSYDTDGRKAFVEDMFAVLEAPGVKTVSELQDGGIGTLRTMLKQMENVNPETRKTIEKLISILFDQVVGSIPWFKRS